MWTGRRRFDSVPRDQTNLRLGLDARIGLEDGKTLLSSEEAMDNAELIRAARALMAKQFVVR